MTLALTFATPLLLIGLLAAGIPFVLHLLSSVRARQEPFPTLRFLRLSMEKTARRRRIQHWLLLLLRAVLLALLAVAVAEPISRLSGGWLGQRRAAVIVLDNSLSMAAGTEGQSRLSRAKSQAARLLSEDSRPQLAEVLISSGQEQQPELSADLKPLRDRIARASLSYGRCDLARRVAQAVSLLKDETSASHRAIYVLSDMQLSDLSRIQELRELTDAAGMQLFLVDASAGPTTNVGISEVNVLGRRVRDAVLEFAVTVVNSAPEQRNVTVVLEPGDGSAERPRASVSLQPAGREGARKTVRFLHQFTQEGPVEGRVLLDADDDLAEDNVRRFRLDLGPRTRVLLVRGSVRSGMDPGYTLLRCLQPWRDPQTPWPIEARTVEWEQFAASDLDWAGAAIFAQVPAFTPEQAAGIADFVSGGGTAMFFLGPDADTGNYNQLLQENASVETIRREGGLLPNHIGEPTGQVGDKAKADPVQWADIDHPLLAGIHKNMNGYLDAYAQRYYQLREPVGASRTLIKLESGQPLVAAKSFGEGQVLLIPTTSSFEWTSFPRSTVFLPMLFEACMQADVDPGSDRTYQIGQQVTIAPDRIAPSSGGASPSAIVDLPAVGTREETFVTLPLADGRTTFDGTTRPGMYRWRIEGAGPDSQGIRGSFAVNPYGPESEMQPMDTPLLLEGLRRRGLEQAYAGQSLDQVHAQARQAAEGRNWWDILVLAVIFLLVVEAVIANRRPAEPPAAASLGGAETG